MTTRDRCLVGALMVLGLTLWILFGAFLAVYVLAPFFALVIVGCAVDTVMRFLGVWPPLSVRVRR